MRYWSGSVDVSCVLCNEPLEKIEHLFSECVYYAQIWEGLMKSVLRNEYTESWIRLMKIMRDPRISKVKSFIINIFFRLQFILYGEKGFKEGMGKPLL